MIGRIAYVFTDACKQIAYMVKQLNYLWLTAEITVTTTKYIEYINRIYNTHPRNVLLFLSRGVGKVLL